MRAAPVKYSGHKGAMLAGNDLPGLASGNFTTAEAEARCTAIKDCVGFTWKIAESGGNTTSNTRIHTYFKTAASA